jgi:hypothetical protein
VGDDRVIETQESPAWLAKNRYGLPKQINLDWSELAAGLDRGLAEVSRRAPCRSHAAPSRASPPWTPTEGEAARVAAAAARVTTFARLSVLLNRAHRTGIATRSRPLSADNAPLPTTPTPTPDRI